MIKNYCSIYMQKMIKMAPCN